MFSVIWLLSVLVMTASDDLTNGELNARIGNQKKSKETLLPLMRFHFVHSLVNPCDFQSDVFESEESHESFSSLRNLDGNGEIPLAKLAHDFLTPFRDLIDVRPAHHPNNLNDTKSEEELSFLTQEFKLVVSQALQLIRRIYSPSVLRNCNGFQMQSLPRENLFDIFHTNDIHLEELYRSLMIIAAHLHVMIRDVHDSKRFCSSESVAYLQIMRQLIGKVKTSLCLVLHSAIVSRHEGNVDYFRVTHEVIQSFLHRYYSCSAREIRECLVMNYTEAIFGFVQCYIDN